MFFTIIPEFSHNFIDDHSLHKSVVKASNMCTKIFLILNSKDKALKNIQRKIVNRAFVKSILNILHNENCSTALLKLCNT